MSGDLEIRSGGIIAVDTADLRSAAARLDLLRADVDRVADALRAVERQLAGVDEWLRPRTDLSDLVAGELARLVDDLRRLADLYEATPPRRPS
jgi:hypothetical protein